MRRGELTCPTTSSTLSMRATDPLVETSLYQRSFINKKQKQNQKNPHIDLKGRISVSSNVFSMSIFVYLEENILCGSCRKVRAVGSVWA